MYRDRAKKENKGVLIFFTSDSKAFGADENSVPAGAIITDSKSSLCWKGPQEHLCHGGRSNSKQNFSIRKERVWMAWTITGLTKGHKALNFCCLCLFQLHLYFFLFP